MLDDSASMNALSQRSVRGITLADIAKRAGVSLVTASRTLRNSAPVARPTRERVLAAARELRYTPNLLARGLVENRSATFGVVLHELANPFFAPIVSAIQTMAAERDFLVMIGESGRDEAMERRYVERFEQLRAAALVVHPASRAADHLDAAREHGTAVVMLARHSDQGHWVAVDNVEGGRLAARHLLERGHTRVGLVAPADVENTPVQERVLGFREALATAGGDLPAPYAIRTEATSFDDGVYAAERFLAMSEMPSAVFTASDRMAMGLVHRLLERAVRVPEEVAVVGFDNMPYAAYAQVPLTTLALPARRMGELAAEILFDELASADAEGHRQVMLQPELVVRASSP